MDGIRYWIETEGTGHWFFLAFPVVLLILFISFKGRRVRFLIPSLIISLVIINPLFYKYWDALGLYAYWRILWVVPVIPVVAGLVPSITERIQKSWLKGVVSAAGVGLVFLGGTFLYNGAGGSFVEAANAAKLPDDVVAVADRLLELDDSLRVIAQHPVGVYIRQYSGNIDSLYGRDIDGYIMNANSEAKSVHQYLGNGDIESVAQYMVDNEYDYLIYEGEVSVFFVLMDQVGEYGIYKPNTTPSVIRERNTLGEVTTITTVDRSYRPVNNAEGYAIVNFEYDNNGCIKHEKYYDETGNPVNTSFGYAEIQRINDGKGRCIKEVFFDDVGKLMIQPAGNVAIEQEYDNEDNLISRTYIDRNGLKMERIDGYSKAVWKKTDTGAIIEFYNLEDQKIEREGINLVDGVKTFSDGWSEWIVPDYNVENSCQKIGSFCLPLINEGDIYTCQIEIEFANVETTEDKQFRFWTQGAQDGK